MKISRIYFSIQFAILFLVFNFDMFSQEIIVPLRYDITVSGGDVDFKKNGDNYKKNKKIELPFFDDFSYSDYIPSSDLWADSSVFVNRVMAVAPPTIGVATFDAINKYGEVYSLNGKIKYIPGDVLTSNPIVLNSSMSGVYLSFAYQPQGICDLPESADSLVVQFYSPTDDKWESQFVVEGSKLHDFKFVMLPVTGQKFLQDGFRFRFINYISLSSTVIKPSFVGNVDFWHVDYVYLNKDRSSNDTIFNDVAFSSQISSLLKGYNSIPWKHYVYSEADFMADKLEVSLSNLSSERQSIIGFNYYLKDVFQDVEIPYDIAGGISMALEAGSITKSSIKNVFEFTRNKSDSAKFEVRCSYNADSDDPIQNNTVVRNHDFYNYYAYDDATAEVGYGLSGEGSRYGNIALKYESLIEDTLQAIQIYFNRTFEDVSKVSFYIYIWENADTVPGAEIFSQYVPVSSWEYATRVGQFITIPLEEKILMSGSFWIGIQQVTEDLLNIGLDLNTNSSDKLCFDVGAGWQKSKISGALMLRPVMGKPIEISSNGSKNETGIDDYSDFYQIQIYPNPVADLLRVDFDPTLFGKLNKVRIYDTQGRLVADKSGMTTVFALDVSRLQGSLYVVRLFSNDVLICTEKIIKLAK